ncbi:hypothetical protein CMMCAS03_05095 [Clavibacter michiganensis subsp. michiganensis]|nr:hypothetical protein DOU02_05705 [Clavibacter michiganensis subsp. michiganensis]OUD92712.1 hypothetical protein CMMCAS05_07385 [Clavibacter michiganensis subsp. michiganensis]OUD93603.1 hypothetical protein CMMCAS03_05095 [Clavibacter michiganensis subsp. michiganensis]OUE05585.1 hypothetical protein CMMCAS08_02300 [Clavibacter michiganensis subsp. michiganensis]
MVRPSRLSSSCSSCRSSPCVSTVKRIVSRSRSASSAPRTIEFACEVLLTKSETSATVPERPVRSVLAVMFGR